MTRLLPPLSLVAVLFAFLAMLPGLVSAQTPAKGTLMLVAKPSLEPPYGQTVLLVVPIGRAEHVGFILNRPLDQKMSTLFPDNMPAKKVADPVRFGGPVMSDTVFAIAASPEDPNRESLPLFDDVVVATSAAVITRIMEQSPNDARYFVGFVGWQPGELEAEIARGFWYVMEPRPDLVFRRDARGMWKELVEPLERSGSAQRTSLPLPRPLRISN
jgi:putative transcriptional regulator